MKIYNYDPEKVRNVGIGIVVQIFVSASRNVYLFLTISAHFFNFKKKEVFIFPFKKKICIWVIKLLPQSVLKKGKKEENVFF